MTTPLVWFITGASSGFGSTLALHALRSGHHVIGAVRSPVAASASNPKIEELGGRWIEFDVNWDAATINAQVVASIKLFGRLDVVVNSAAYSLLGAMEDISDEEAHAQMETNFFGPMKVIRAVLPTLRKQMSGTIVNISSAATVFNRPGFSMYAASKLALEGMTESLSRELVPFNIRVISVVPGAFRSNFLNAAAYPSSHTVSPIAHVSPPYHTGSVNSTLQLMADLSTNWNLGKPVGGSLEKACARIFEVVTETGMAEKEKVVVGEGFTLLLGEDSVARVEEKIVTLKEGLEGVRALAESTQY